MTRLNLQPTLGQIVRNWLGTDRVQTDLVLEIMEELARDRDIDLEEAPIEVVRKLADEGFQWCEDERWFKDF